MIENHPQIYQTHKKTRNFSRNISLMSIFIDDGKAFQQPFAPSLSRFVFFGVEVTYFSKVFAIVSIATPGIRSIPLNCWLSLTACSRTFKNCPFVACTLRLKLNLNTVQKQSTNWHLNWTWVNLSKTSFPPFFALNIRS